MNFVMLGMLLFAAGQEPVAYVDLSVPLKAPPPSAFTAIGSGCVRGGGLYDGPNPTKKSAPAFTLRVIRVVESADKAPSRDGAVEVLLTNTSSKPIRVPIGVDDESLLRAPANERQFLGFSVRIGGVARDDTGVSSGFSRAASNAEHPESTFELKPGDSIEFKVPFSKGVAGYKLAERGLAEGTVTASVILFRIVTDKDRDCWESTGMDVESENSLQWTPPKK